MKTAAEYRGHAEECRRLAASAARPQDKPRAWRVADDREAQLLKQIDGRSGLNAEYRDGILKSLGAEAKPPVFSMPGGFAVNAH
jgi:hypothetical protein